MSIPGNANPLLLATAAEAAAAAVVTKSLRFNDGDSAYLGKTFSSAGNRRTWTFSAWVKRVELGTTDDIFNAGGNASQPRTEMRFKADDTFTIGFNPAGTTWYSCTTTAVFRDPSAWYHIVVECDTTQATDTNRLKLYINGVLQTFGSTSFVAQNTQLPISDSTYPHSIGRYQSGGSAYFHGYMADIHFIDGSALDATSFGAFDDNGVWQAAAYSGTFGTNGFHLLDFANESTIGHDSSGNENDFTANNLSATGTAAPAVTSNGNPTSSTDSPFSSGYSVDFDGDDSLTITGPGAIAGDFTVECFVKSSSYAGTQRIFSADQASQSGERLNLRCYNGATEFYVAPGVSASGTTFPTNQWNHIAITRSGSDVSYYLNGSRWATDTHSGAISVTTFVVAHGFASEYFTGKVSNARFVDGQALYTGASYTQPTATLTTTSQGATAANVRLICCHQSSVTAAEGSVADPPSADILFDVPTNGTQSDTGAGGEVSGNYCTWNSIAEYDPSPTFSNGNLEFTASGDWHIARGTIGVKTGKYYAEFTTVGATMLGIETEVADAGRPYFNNSVGCIALRSNGQVFIDNVAQTTLGGWSDGDVIGMALNLDGSSFVVTKNNSAYTTISIPSNSYWNDKNVFYSATALSSNDSVTANWGQRAYSYSAPSNHKALCTTNLPTPTIADGSDYFQTGLYTGTGSSSALAVSGPANPDFVWIKRRSGATSHALYDVLRGFDERLYSNSNTSAYTYGSDILAPTSTGFNLTTTDSDHNTSGGTYVAWQWDAASSTASNTDGSITSSVRANQTAGFSIVSYVGTGNNDTVGHGLNAAPEFMLIKNRDVATDWDAYHVATGESKYLVVNGTNAAASSSWMQDTAPTNSVYSVASGTYAFNRSGNDIIAYCFAPVAGYSAFGSYTGNGSADGPFIYTGFKPRWVMYKRSDSTADWEIKDSARDAYNLTDETLIPNTSGAAYTGYGIDILSNGFKPRTSGNAINNSGGTYIYAAFAENPFSANGGLAR